MRHGNYILLAISLLLVVREAFATATVKNSAKQSNEHWWYPFLAVTELLAVILFATPGLVPRQDEVPEYAMTDAGAYTAENSRRYAADPDAGPAAPSYVGVRPPYDPAGQPSYHPAGQPYHPAGPYPPYGGQHYAA